MKTQVAEEGSMTTAATEKLQLKIGGMHCSLCVKSIRKALGRVDGVQSVQVSIAHEEALVTSASRAVPHGWTFQPET
jgi:copper chaperone CopZ